MQAILLVLAISIVGPESASFASGDTLHLEDILRSIAVNNRAVRSQSAIVARHRAQVQQARAVYDPTIEFATSSGTSPGIAASGATAVLTGVDVAVVQRTGLGLAVSARTTVAPGVAGVPGAVQNELGLSGSLLHFGARNPDRIQRQAVRHAAMAAVLDARHILSRELTAGAIAFWHAWTEQERLSILLDSETRAADVLRIIDRLVEAGERPASDAVQAEAFVADRTRDRIVAEQSWWEAVGQLAVATGKAVESLVEAALIPEVEPIRSNMDALSRDAVQSRADIKAAGALLEAAHAGVSARRLERLPRLSLEGTVSNHHGPASLEANAWRVGARLRLVGGLTSRAARANLAVEHARASEHQIGFESKVEEAKTAAVVAAARNNSAFRELEAAQSALRIHEQGVTNERKRLSAGVATVYDVVLAEDRLRQARIAVATARARAGQTTARLAHERGHVVRGSQESPALWTVRLFGAGLK